MLARSYSTCPQPHRAEREGGHCENQNCSKRKRQSRGQARRRGAALHDWTLEGLKLIGFGVWERKTGSGRNVTFPARTYSVNGERRSFALLRPSLDSIGQDRVRDLVLDAYAAQEQQSAEAL